jgi:hypothetical protein
LPPDWGDVRHKFSIAEAPEFNSRLRQEFPLGTDDASVVSKLTRMGFRILASCDTDPSIRIARFDQTGASLYPLTARVYWKVGRHKEVVWVRGFVSYTGL